MITEPLSDRTRFSVKRRRFQSRTEDGGSRVKEPSMANPGESEAKRQQPQIGNERMEGVNPHCRRQCDNFLMHTFVKIPADMYVFCAAQEMHVPGPASQAQRHVCRLPSPHDYSRFLYKLCFQYSHIHILGCYTPYISFTLIPK